MRKSKNFIVTILSGAKRIEKIMNGLSNDNYLVTTKYNERLIVRIANEANKSLFNRKQEYQITKLIAPYKIDVPVIYFDEESGNKVTLYQKGFYHIDTYSESDVVNVAKIIKKLHSIPVNLTYEFDPLTKLYDYLNKIDKNIFANYDELISKFNKIKDLNKKVLCHNDIVKGNLLFKGDLVNLIDYEFAALNNPLFDLASFISENNIEDERLKLTFLRAYYSEKFNDDILNQFNIYHCFEDLLWSIWAYMRYTQTSELIFYDIYKFKKNRLDKNIKLL
jgi:thiamine kinase-like enzyme